LQTKRAIVAVSAGDSCRLRRPSRAGYAVDRRNGHLFDRGAVLPDGCRRKLMFGIICELPAHLYKQKCQVCPPAISAPMNLLALFARFTRASLSPALVLGHASLSADEHLPQRDAPRTARVNAGISINPAPLANRLQTHPAAASGLFASRLPPETGSPFFTDCCSWRGRRDSCPLAKSAGRGGAPEHVDSADDRAARGSWRGRRDSNPRPPA
jgi:hypothetical protein